MTKKYLTNAQAITYGFGVVLILSLGISAFIGRRSEPPRLYPELDGPITVTEREAMYMGSDSTHPSAYLKLDIDDYALDWNRPKLIKLGFDPGDLAKGRYERRDLYGVVEYDGPFFKDWFDGGARTDRWDFETHSRFFPVDAGVDPIALRQAYPDRKRYVIVPAKIELFYEDYGKQDTSDDVREVSFTVTVVKEFPLTPEQAVFLKGKKPTPNKMLEPIKPEWKPRYRAVVVFGNDLQPGVRELKAFDDR